MGAWSPGEGGVVRGGGRGGGWERREGCVMGPERGWPMSGVLCRECDGPMYGMAIGPMYGVAIGPMYGVAIGPMYGVAIGPMHGVAIEEERHQ